MNDPSKRQPIHDDLSSLAPKKGGDSKNTAPRGLGHRIEVALILKKYFKEMPPPIRVLFFLFFLTPFVSMLCGLFSHFGEQTTWSIVVFSISYWIMPLLLCYAIIAKHYLFLPFYLLQCLALGVQSFSYTHDLVSDILIVRLFVIGMMVYIGILFANRDFLAPFLTGQNRHWRKHPRIEVYHSIDLRSPDEKWNIPATLKNYSAGGMAISVDEKHSKLLNVKKGDRIVATVRTIEGTRSVLTEIAWASPQCRLGLQALDTTIMGELMMLLQRESENRALSHSAPTSILQYQMKASGFFLWVFFISLAFGLPAFG